MRIIQKSFLASLVTLCLLVSSCGPNDNAGSMDQNNSNKEGSVDSTRLTNMDSTSMSQGDSIK